MQLNSQDATLLAVAAGCLGTGIGALTDSRLAAVAISVGIVLLVSAIINAIRTASAGE